MAGVEAYRPQNKEAAFDNRQNGGLPSQEGRYGRSEVHYGGRIETHTRIGKDGQPIDISRLYTDGRTGGPTRWWTERQSNASFLEEVRVGHERGDPFYQFIPERIVPRAIVAHRPHIPENILRQHPEYAQREWITLHYGDGKNNTTIRFLNPRPHPAEEPQR